jgi:hypothetical protein
MNDHHFSYPVVVPLPGAKISGHAAAPPAPVGLMQPVRLVHTSVRVRRTAAAVAAPELAWRAA